MKILDIARRARRSLAQAKARTILTSLAIGVGAFTITLSLAAGVGGKDYASSIITSNINEKQIFVTKKSEAGDGPNEYSSNGKTNLDFAGTGKIQTLSDEDVTSIRNVNHVLDAVPSFNPTPLYITQFNTQKKYELPMVGTYDAAIQLKYVAGGVSDTVGRGVIITDEYRKALKFSSPQSAIGKKVDIVVVKGAVPGPQAQTKTFSFPIRGVIEEKTSAVSVQAPVLVGQDLVRDMYEYQYADTSFYRNFAAVFVTTDNKNNTQIVKKTLEQKGYQAQTAEDLMQFIFQFINVLQGILLGFGALAVLTAIFGIINTQYISVLERTQQIGLMKALGMRRRDVGRLFKFEAAWIGFLGGAIGSGLAYATGLIANPYITKALTLDEGTNLLLFPIWIFASVIIGLMIVSVAAGILPARKAAKLDPIEALRTE